MQKYKAIKTDYGYLIIRDKKSNNYLTAHYYDGKEVVASSHEIYSRLPTFDVPEEWEDCNLDKMARHNYWNKTKKVIAENSRPDMVIGYIDGFNAAKEIYKWTDEDMMDALKTGHIIGLKMSIDKEDVVFEFENYLQGRKQPKEYFGALTPLSNGIGYI